MCPEAGTRRCSCRRRPIDIHDDGWQLTGLDGTGTALVRRPRNTPGRRRGGPASPFGTFFRTVPD